MNYLSKISLSAINQKFFDDLKKGGPFGYANNNPFFFIEKIKIIKPKILKKNILVYLLNLDQVNYILLFLIIF